MIKLCGNCAFWWDKHKVEDGHRLGECCRNTPQLVMGQMQVPSGIQRAGGPGVHTVAQQMGLSPPCTENRPGCYSHEWNAEHAGVPMFAPKETLSAHHLQEITKAMDDYALKSGGAK